MNLIKIVIFLCLIFLFNNIIFSAASQSSANSNIPVNTDTNAISSTTPGTNNNTNNLQFISDVTPVSTNPSSNIIFDNYDEVEMQNYDKQNITHIKFLGNVKIRFDNNILKARTVIITATSNRVLDISAYDKVEFQYGDSLYLADYMSFNPETKQGLLKNVRSFVKNANSQSSQLSSASGWYYHAKKVTILSDDKVVLEDVNATFTPAEIPHYSFYFQKLWYFKKDIIFALFDTYTVGQGDLFWFPFYMRWERITGIRTAFGQEKRIGWYLMNTADLTLDYGNYNVGLDIYERLGQYMFVNFKNTKPIGVLAGVNINFQGANDTRVFYDSANDRFTQLVLINGVYTNIQQVSWDYKASITVATNDASITVNWEDLNDPFFQAKYNQRREEFHIQDLVDPADNNWYSQSDESPSVTSIKRGFTLGYKNFSMNGNWTFNRVDVPSEPNIYLNDRYKFLIYNVSFPNITYTLGKIDIFNDINYTFPVSKQLKISNTNFTIGLNEDESAYLNPTQTNTNLTNKKSDYPDNETNINLSITNQPQINTTVSEPEYRYPEIGFINSNMTLLPQADSNQSAYRPVTIVNTNMQLQPIRYSVTTNQYVLYNFSSYVNASFNYNSSQYLDTNQLPTSDQYDHWEDGNYTIAGKLFNSYVGWDNSLIFHNQNRWSTFTNVAINNQNYTGYEVDYATTGNINQNPSINTGSFWQVNFPYYIKHTFTYQLIDTEYSYSLSPLYYWHDTGIGSGVNLFENNLGLSLSGTHHIKYRNTNDVDDVYLNNITERTAGANAVLKVTWFTFSTGTLLNILETKTNSLLYTYEDFTDRIVPGNNPQLKVSFKTPDPIQPQISADYTYDFILKTNVNADFSTEYKLQNIYDLLFYKIELLDIKSLLYWDFLTPRSTYFTLNFTTTLWFDRYWRMTYGTSVRNSYIYRYIREYTDLYNESYNYTDFWENLQDSLSIWDYSRLQKGLFTIQAFHIDITHDLNEWEMKINFDLNRRVDNLNLVAYWEPTIMVQFYLRDDRTIQFPPYQRKFVPAQYQ